LYKRRLNYATSIARIRVCILRKTWTANNFALSCLSTAWQSQQQTSELPVLYCGKWTMIATLLPL